MYMLSITEKQKELIDDVLYELNINNEHCRVITDKIVDIIENRDRKKQCSVCECWIDKSQSRCHFCESEI